MGDFLAMPTRKSLQKRIEAIKKEQERREQRIEAATHDDNSDVIWDPEKVRCDPYCITSLAARSKSNERSRTNNS